MSALPHFGLEAHTISEICELLGQYSEIEDVLVFGSRARGSYHSNSDIDLAVFAPKMTEETFVDLWTKTQNLDFPLKIDLVLFHWIDIPAFKKNILEDGVMLRSITL